MRNFKKYIILLTIILTAGIILSLTYTFAKYVKDTFWEYHLKSKEFYFSSSELNQDEKINVNNSWDGKEVYFTLNNSQNEELITDYDINYDVTCRVLGAEALHTECHLNGKSSSEDSGVLTNYEGCINNKQDEVDVSGYSKSTCELEGYTWKNQKATKDLYFNIVLTDPDYELETISVNIEVKSTLPYKKTLKGNFTLYKNSDIETTINIEYEDYNDYGKLILSNLKKDTNCTNIKWDASKILIENDLLTYESYLLDTNGYINEINIGIDKSLYLMFYKKTSDKLTLKDFIIGECNS